jgi:hypothetical protein
VFLQPLDEKMYQIRKRLDEFVQAFCLRVVISAIRWLLAPRSYDNLSSG